MSKRLAFRLMLACAVLSGFACTRPRPQTASAPLATTPSAPVADATAAQPGNLTAQSSEFIATNTADPHCTDCQHGDATSAPTYFGKPGSVLDEETIKDAGKTVDATCDVLEAGVAILEKHAKEPEKAAAALDEYRKKHGAELAKVFEQARMIKARLRAAGYAQDIPLEIRPHFEERMTKIQDRLETMRSTYRKYPDVLESFGALFPH